MVFEGPVSEAVIALPASHFRALTSLWQPGRAYACRALHQRLRKEEVQVERAAVQPRKQRAASAYQVLHAHAAIVMQRPGAATALMAALAAQEWATSLLGEQYAAYKASALARPGALQPPVDAESSHEGCMASMAVAGSLKNAMQLPA